MERNQKSTISDFKECLPLIEKSIFEATFIAIDAEFTGLSVQGSTINALDTPEDRYRKLKKAVEEFMLLQFGMCTFVWDRQKAKYICRPFNFYIFPKPFSRQAPDRRFTCQTSSIDFLASQDFDFNKVFKEGISYLLPDDEQKLRDSLVEKHRSIDAVTMKTQLSSPAFTSPACDMNTSQVGKGPPQVPDEHKSFIQNICNQIDNFKKSNKKEMPLDPCSGYLRKLIYLTVGQSYSTDVYVESRTNGQGRRHLVVTKLGSEEELRNKEATKRAAEYEELDDAVGFSKVIQMISRSGKAVVGHNMILDLLYTTHQFMCPLPELYKDFKSMIGCIFPKIVDTKLMSSMHPFKEIFFSTVLRDLHKMVSLPPLQRSNPPNGIAEGFPNYNSATEKLHEAGYDAYITGLIFTSLSNYLGIFQEAKPSVILPGSELLQPFVNKLFLMRVYDIPYMNLSGEDLKPDRSHVFHLAFPGDWRVSDISQLFSPFGAVQIAWLDDTSAFITLMKKDNSETVMKSLSKAAHYRIMTYEEHMMRRVSNSADFYPTTSTPVHLAPKRKLPMSDTDLPSREKRRRSRSNEGTKTSPFPSNRSITTIVEEAEEEPIQNTNGEGGEETCVAGGGGSGSVTVEEDLGVPVEKRSKMDNIDTANISGLLVS